MRKYITNTSEFAFTRKQAVYVYYAFTDLRVGWAHQAAVNRAPGAASRPDEVRTTELLVRRPETFPERRRLGAAPTARDFLAFSH